MHIAVGGGNIYTAVVELALPSFPMIINSNVRLEILIKFSLEIFPKFAPDIILCKRFSLSHEEINKHGNFNIQLHVTIFFD